MCSKKINKPMRKLFKNDAHTRRLAADRQARRRAKLKGRKQKPDNKDCMTPAELLAMHEQGRTRGELDEWREYQQSLDPQVIDAYLKKQREAPKEPEPPIKYALVSDGRNIAWRTQEDWTLKVQPHLKSPEGRRDENGNLRPNDKGDDLRKLYGPDDYAHLSPWIREANEALHGSMDRYHEWTWMKGEGQDDEG
jgi:hypothetical protein